MVFKKNNSVLKEHCCAIILFVYGVRTFSVFNNRLKLIKDYLQTYTVNKPTLSTLFSNIDYDNTIVIVAISKLEIDIAKNNEK